MKSISNDSSKWYKTPWTSVAIFTVCNSDFTRKKKKKLHVTNPILCLSHRKLFSLCCYGEWKKSDVRRLRYIVLHLTISVFRIRYIFSLSLCINLLFLLTNSINCCMCFIYSMACVFLPFNFYHTENCIESNHIKGIVTLIYTISLVFMLYSNDSWCIMKM